MAVCGCCQKEYKLGLKDRIARKTVEKFANRLIGLKEATEQAKNYCNECWHEIVDPLVPKLR